jgi:beta-lactamase class A
MSRKTILLLLLTISSFAQKPSLKTNMDDFIAKLPPHLKVSVSLNSLVESRTQYHRNANMLVPAASLIKLPILIELLYQEDEDRLDLDDEITFDEKDIADQDGSLHQNSVGKKFKFRELARLMMVASDNSATNIIINKISKEAVNARMKSLGFQQIYLNRKMMDTAAVRLGIQNFVSSREMNLLLSKVYNQEILNKKYCKYILELMNQCNDKTTFPAGLPKGVGIAHKTGTLGIVRSDAAIINADYPFALTALVEGFKTESEAENILAQIATIAYESQKIKPKK